MSEDSRDVAARALLRLLGKGGPYGTPYPADYADALAVVDALAAHTETDRPITHTEREAANDG